MPFKEEAVAYKLNMHIRAKRALPKVVESTSKKQHLDRVEYVERSQNKYSNNY